MLAQKILTVGMAPDDVACHRKIAPFYGAQGDYLSNPTCRRNYLPLFPDPLLPH
jgi:hypothetical protein